VNLFEVALAGGEEPHVTGIAILCTVLVVVLFTPVKTRVQEGIDRLFFRERYNSRKALLRLSQDLNADLDLDRIAERLLEGVRRALGVSSMAVFLPSDEGTEFTALIGWPAEQSDARLPADGPLIQRLAAERRQAVVLRGPSEEIRFLLVLTKLADLFHIDDEY
jgi:hypothetical protein